MGKSSVKNKKICLFMVPPLTTGAGAEKYFIELANDLATRGPEVDIVTLDRQFFKVFRRLLRIFYRLDFFSSVDYSQKEKRSTIEESLGNANWVEVSLGDLKGRLSEYDVIYSKNEVVELILLKIHGYKNLPPVIVGVHTPLHLPIATNFHAKLHNYIYLGFLYKWLTNGVALVHLSNSYTKDLVDRLFNIPTKLIYYPFSTDEIQESARTKKANYEFDKKKFNIMFAARMTEQKGVDTLVWLTEEWAKDEDIIGKMHLNIFGSGALESLVEGVSEKYDFATYFGVVESEYIPNILSKQSAFITTSKWETSPYNVLEAQGVGLPVVAFDIPGPNDIIVNGSTGFLAESKEEFLRMIKLLVIGEAKFVSKDVADTVKSKFDPQKIYDDLYEMFLESYV